MLKKEEMISAVLDGIIESNNFYEKISAGYWLTDSAVESIMQTKIAETIHKKLGKNSDGTRIVMEFHIRSIIEYSESKKLRGRIPALIGEAKRVDILIIDKDGYPIVPIEIKRSASSDGFALDADRVLGILKRSDSVAGGTVKYGLICGFIYGKGENIDESTNDRKYKLNKYRENMQNQLPEQNFEFRYILDEPVDFGEVGFWSGGAVCVYLRRSRIHTA